MTRRSRRWEESCVNAAKAPDPLVQPERRYVQADRSASVGSRAIMFSSATDYRRSGSRPSSARRNSRPKLTKRLPSRSRFTVTGRLHQRAKAAQRGPPALPTNRRSLARCAGTGTATSKATTGSEISASALRAWRRRLASSAPGRSRACCRRMGRSRLRC